ncbi:hypothetical protein IW262DRAFT_1297365 [Armillaria fumosa]|nr:hypothetical protein IW262DRAFT_1297365 [Armillaria fumosa]
MGTGRIIKESANATWLRVAITHYSSCFGPSSYVTTTARWWSSLLQHALGLLEDRASHASRLQASSTIGTQTVSTPLGLQCLRRQLDPCSRRVSTNPNPDTPVYHLNAYDYQHLHSRKSWLRSAGASRTFIRIARIVVYSQVAVVEANGKRKHLERPLRRLPEFDSQTGQARLGRHRINIKNAEASSIITRYHSFPFRRYCKRFQDADGYLYRLATLADFRIAKRYRLARLFATVDCDAEEPLIHSTLAWLNCLSLVDFSEPQASSSNPAHNDDVAGMVVDYDSDERSNPEDLRAYATPSAKLDNGVPDKLQVFCYSATSLLVYSTGFLQKMVDNVLLNLGLPSGSPGIQENTPAPVSFQDRSDDVSVSAPSAQPESFSNLGQKSKSSDAFKKTPDMPPPNKKVALTRDEPTFTAPSSQYEKNLHLLTLAQRIKELETTLAAEQRSVQTHLEAVQKLQTTLKEKELTLQHHRAQATESENARASLESKHQDDIKKEKEAWRTQAEQLTRPLIQTLNQQKEQALVFGKENDKLREQLSQAEEKCLNAQQQLASLQSKTNANEQTSRINLNWETAFTMVKPQVDEALEILKQKYTDGADRLKKENERLRQEGRDLVNRHDVERQTLEQRAAMEIGKLQAQVKQLEARALPQGFAAGTSPWETRAQGWPTAPNIGPVFVNPFSNPAGTNLETHAQFRKTHSWRTATKHTRHPSVFSPWGADQRPGTTPLNIPNSGRIDEDIEMGLPHDDGEDASASSADEGSSSIMKGKKKKKTKIKREHRFTKQPEEQTRNPDETLIMRKICELDQRLLGIKRDKDVHRTIDDAGHVTSLEQADAYFRGEFPMGPSLDHYRPCWEVLTHRWNLALSKLFVDRFLAKHQKEHPGWASARRFVADHFMQRLRTLKSAHQKHSKGIGELSLPINRRARRRTGLYENRLKFTMQNKGKDVFLKLFNIIDRCDALVMSSDESSDEGVLKRYNIHGNGYLVRQKGWRNDDLIRLLKWIDRNRDRASRTAAGNTKGTARRIRLRLPDREAPASNRSPIAGLPVNFYDSHWFSTLMPDEIEGLNPQAAMDLPTFVLTWPTNEELPVDEHDRDGLPLYSK